jgi:formylglycine-generating enzyme required for sulfatase activity
MSRPGWLDQLRFIAIGIVIGVIGFVIAAVATHGFGLLASLEAATPTWASTIPLPESATAGVTRNADWTSYVEEINGVRMALVPAGCFMMGSTNEQIGYAMRLFGQGAQRSWFLGEHPAHRVCFDRPFWIDVTEVTNGQYGGAHPDCAEYSSGDNQPRVCVTWEEAQAYCQSRGARLPTEAEWEYAARGPDGLIFPWSNTFDGDLVVWNTSAAADVGSEPEGVSWVGALDLSGNVWEWVNDWYSRAYYGTLGDEVINPQGPDSGEDRVIRGGSWFNYDAVSLRNTARGWSDPSLPLHYIGFRCALSY